MRRLLAAAAVIGLSLTALSPIEVQAAILLCGDKVITVNSSMERFRLRHILQEIEGYARFTSEQINFEYVTAMGIGNDKFLDFKHIYSINRKSLKYKYAMLTRIAGPSGIGDWKAYRLTDSKPNPTEIGQCSIV